MPQAFEEPLRYPQGQHSTQRQRSWVGVLISALFRKRWSEVDTLENTISFGLFFSKITPISPGQHSVKRGKDAILRVSNSKLYILPIIVQL